MNIEREWDILSPKIPPIAYLLKHIYRDEWVRFHHLPDSKRYSESKLEFETIISRNTVLLDYLSNESDNLYIFGPKYSRDDIARKTFKYFKKVSKKISHFENKTITECDGFEVPAFNIFYSQFKICNLEKVIKYTSEELLSNIIIANFDSQFIFHPYDGGMDYIVKNSNTRYQLVERFSDWLP